MTKKKPEKPEHVVLSKETVDKLLARDEMMGKLLDPGEGPVMRLAAWDIIALERKEFEARLHWSSVKAMEAQQVAIEAAHRTLVLETKAKEDENRAKLEDARKLGDRLTNDHRKLAEDMAARYGFKWSTHSYDTETGEVTET